MTNENAINILRHLSPPHTSKAAFDAFRQAIEMAIEALKESQIIRCKDCKHHWTHECMDSMPIERCDLEQTFYDAEVDYCSLAEMREVTT